MTHTPAYQIAARILRDAYAGSVVPPLRAYLAPTDATGAYAVQTLITIASPVWKRDASEAR